MCLKSTVERRKYECIFKPLYFVKPFNKLKSQLIHKISWLTFLTLCAELLFTRKTSSYCTYDSISINLLSNSSLETMEILRILVL